jgi:hypothetical protein
MGKGGKGGGDVCCEKKKYSKNQDKFSDFFYLNFKKFRKKQHPRVVTKPLQQQQQQPHQLLGARRPRRAVKRVAKSDLTRNSYISLSTFAVI